MSAAAVASPSTPENKLKQAQEQLKASEEKYKETRQKRDEAQEKLDEIQDRVMSLAKEARHREDALLKLEQDQKKLEDEVANIHREMKKGRKEITALLSALVRLAHVPREAVVAMPGRLHDNMQAAGVLRTMTEKLRAATRHLTARLERLDENRHSLEVKRYEIANEREKVSVSQSALEEELDERKEVYEALNRKSGAEKLRIAGLVRQSQDMQQLLQKLERERAAKEKAVAVRRPETTAIPSIRSTPEEQWKPQQKTAQNAPISSAARFSSFPAAKGKLRYPVAGAIAEYFGQRLGQNRTSRGITLASRAGNSVVAPYTGEVVFTGPFLDYGNMVILRYEGGYHLLIAGLSEINCSNGQGVGVGEPLGRVGGKRGGKLYLELRYQGKPVNPAPWFG